MRRRRGDCMDSFLVKFGYKGGVGYQTDVKRSGSRLINSEVRNGW